MIRNKMKKIKDFIRRLIKDDIAYLVLNHFINNIPFWSVRRMFYKMGGVKIGKGSRIAMGAILMKPSGISIGENTIINQYVLLDGRSGLTIGNNNSISMFAKIYTGTHKSYSDNFEYYGKCTKICDNCWIGTSSIIMPGSELKDFTILSVNSLYKGISSEKDILVGNPANAIRKRDINNKYKIEYKAWFV